MGVLLFLLGVLFFFTARVLSQRGHRFWGHSVYTLGFYLLTVGCPYLSKFFFSGQSLDGAFHTMRFSFCFWAIELRITGLIICVFEMILGELNGGLQVNDLQKKFK
jgi:hypothetical protein